MKKIIFALSLIFANATSFAGGFKEFQHGITKKDVISKTTGKCEIDSKWCFVLKPRSDSTLFGFPVDNLSTTFDDIGLLAKLTEIGVSVNKSQREFNVVAIKALGKPLEFKTTSIQGNNLTIYMWKLKDGSYVGTTWVDQHIDGTPSRNVIGGGVSLYKSATLTYYNSEVGSKKIEALSKSAGKENSKDF